MIIVADKKRRRNTKEVMVCTGVEMSEEIGLTLGHTPTRAYLLNYCFAGMRWRYSNRNSIVTRLREQALP